jgi:hypothetical protein
MFEGRVRKQRTELARRLEQLEASREVGVSFAPIAIGRMYFTEPDSQTDVVPDAPVVTPEPSPLDPVEVGGFPEPPPVWRIRETDR